MNLHLQELIAHLKQLEPDHGCMLENWRLLAICNLAARVEGTDVLIARATDQARWSAQEANDLRYDLRAARDEIEALKTRPVAHAPEFNAAFAKCAGEVPSP